MDNKKVTFLSDLSKKKVVKKNTSKLNETKNWKNSIYGFECANYASKC